MAKKLLMYSQDVGGGRFMLPVVKELIAQRIAPDTVVLVHPLSQHLVEGKRYSAPVQMGKKTLDPVYCKRVLRQLKFTDEEIKKLLQ